ncbi:hypothetical protein R50076_33830 [Gilvimarinus japonicus]
MEGEVAEVWFQKNGGSDFVPVEVSDGGKKVIRWNWTAADTLSFYTNLPD